MSLGFLDHMRVVPDHRIPGMVTYPLDEVLLATLVGVVCGADDWEGVEEVATGALDWLRGFLPFANGIPTAQTLRKVFRLLDTAGAAARLCGVGGLAARRGARGDRRGRQDAARFEDVARRERGAASGFGLRHRGGARARPTSRRREVQRDHGDPGTPGHAQPQGGDRVDRRHGDAEGDRPAHRRQRRGLCARAQRQSDQPA